jgi:hypothetical protein
MKRNTHSIRPITLGLALISLSSCSLPPSTAWKLIRQDGLSNYLAMELGNKPFPASVKNQRLATPSRPSSVASVPWRAQPQTPSGSGTQYLSSAMGGSTATPRTTTPAAPSSASRMVFQVPAPLPAPTPRVAAAPVIAAAPAPANTIVAPRAPSTKPIAAAPTKPEATKPAAPKAPKVPTTPGEPLKQPALVTSAPATPPKLGDSPSLSAIGALTPAAKPNLDLPYGSPVPGRVGLVHSPYAGKLQLVDVSGLLPGQEVKCPYSGKLFRVPTGEQAAATQTETTPPPAETEEKKQ